ncbi:hypothetical protein BHE74_00005724 [Ensete ventricosum]|nr:hypothetical protein BHE74_00005724 [Ensete ventricosum]
METELLELTRSKDALQEDLPRTAIQDYKKSPEFEMGLARIGHVLLEYRYQLALARLQVRHSGVGIKLDPFFPRTTTCRWPMNNPSTIPFYRPRKESPCTLHSSTRRGLGVVELEFFGEVVKGRDGRRLQLIVPHPSRPPESRGKGTTHQSIGSVIESHLSSKHGKVFRWVGASVVGLQDQEPKAGWDRFVLNLGYKRVLFLRLDERFGVGATVFASFAGKRGVCPTTCKIGGRMWVNPLRCSEFGLLVGRSCDIGPPSSAKMLLSFWDRAEVSTRSGSSRVRKFAHVGRD